MSSEITLLFQNKRYPGTKPIVKKISPSQHINMYDLKKSMLAHFAKKVKPTVTDFRFVTPGDPEEINDTADPNYFDIKYNDEDAFKLLKQFNGENIYFRTKQLSVYVKAISKSEVIEMAFPLAYENNSYEKLVTNICDKMPVSQSKPIIHIFQDTKTLDEISRDVDMKLYQEKHLIAYLYPIEVQFNHKFNLSLAYNKPLNKYLPDTLKLKSDNLSFRIDNKDIDISIPIHEILKQYQEEPVIIEIIDNEPSIQKEESSKRKPEKINEQDAEK